MTNEKKYGPEPAGKPALVGGGMNIDDKAKPAASWKYLGHFRLTAVLLLALFMSLSASEGKKWTKIVAGDSQEQHKQYSTSKANAVQTDQAADRILGNVVAAYHSVSTYRDKGTAIIHLTDSDVSYRVEFETLFKRPNKLRFAWTQRNSRVRGYKQRAVIWYDGVTAWCRYSIHGNKLERKRDLEVLVGGATGASWGTAHTVTALLCDEIGGTRLDELRSPRIIRSEVVDGVECVVLLGELPSGGESKIWIDRRNNLIRRIEERFGNVKLEEVLAEISVNEDIVDSRFSESGK